MLRAAAGPRLVLVLLAAGAGAQDAPTPAPAPAGTVLTVTADVQLDPAVVYGGLVLAADGITVDGRGARVVGPVQLAAEAEGVPAPPNTFTGVGVRAAAVNGVRLRNLRVQGFETGLLVEDGRGWRIEDCDLSGNFHDPDFGWGEQGEKGGLVLRRVRDSTLLRTRANRCWNACSLVDCRGLQVQACDFSHASNTCLKLWTVTGSTFTGNDLSWGLRIAPGEVHARDSCCVLVESGSDDNRFERNDATHGGDGFFIRVLNNWTSRRNVFTGNDASYANNNGFEAWSPENTYVDNVANHCSYGFWLGASDKTVLRGNEAGWNGDPASFHNAPESFGHGGIVFVNGPSHHTLVDGNWLHDNAGGGLVLRGDEASDGKAWRAWHWVIQQNRIESNRWGVWMRHASFIDIGPNAFRDNREGDVVDAGDVDGVQRHDGPAGNAPPQLALLESGGPSAPGRIVTATGSVKVEARCDGAEAARPPRIVWDFGDGTSCDGPVVGHQYARPGFYRIGCTASDGALCSLAWLDVDILDVPPPPPSANHEGRWHDGAPTADLPGTMAPGRWTLQAHVGQAATFEAAAGCAPGDVAVHAHVEPYDGDGLVLVWPATRDLALPLAGRATLAFWIRARDPNIPAWQGLNPVLALHADDERWLRLTPTRDLLGDPPDIHFRDEWQLIEVPLAGGDGWTREIGPGGAPDVANWIGVGLDSWGAPLLDVWLDGLALR